MLKNLFEGLKEGLSYFLVFIGMIIIGFGLMFVVADVKDYIESQTMNYEERMLDNVIATREALETLENSRFEIDGRQYADIMNEAYDERDPLLIKYITHSYLMK